MPGPAGRLYWLAMKTVLLAMIDGYKLLLSPFFGSQCRFYPTCSHYAEEAIRERGAVKGTALGGWRILRCNPFGAGGIDHVRDTSEYDDVTRKADRVKA